MTLIQYLSLMHDTDLIFGFDVFLIWSSLIWSLGLMYWVRVTHYIQRSYQGPKITLYSQIKPQIKSEPHIKPKCHISPKYHIRIRHQIQRSYHRCIQCQWSYQSHTSNPNIRSRPMIIESCIKLKDLIKGPDETQRSHRNPTLNANTTSGSHINPKIMSKPHIKHKDEIKIRHHRQRLQYQKVLSHLHIKSKHQLRVPHQG
jgi:hypothetical protein